MEFHLTEPLFSQGDACSPVNKPNSRSDLALALGLSILLGTQVLFVQAESLAVLSVYVLTLIFGCWKTRRAVLMVLPALHFPFAAIYALHSEPFGVYYTDFWQLPGSSFLTAVSRNLRNEPDIWFAWQASLSTVILFLAAVLPARPSRRAAIAVAVGTLAIATALAALAP